MKITTFAQILIVLKNPIKQLFGQTAVYGLGIVLPRLLNYLLLTPFYTGFLIKLLTE